jgi:hypothetical protein
MDVQGQFYWRFASFNTINFKSVRIFCDRLWVSGVSDCPLLATARRHILEDGIPHAFWAARPDEIKPFEDNRPGRMKLNLSRTTGPHVLPGIPCLICH